MYSVFTNTTKSVIKLPPRSNLINYSLLSEYYCKIPFRSFSIKYVSGGHECYTINSTKFKVDSGEYILANNFSNGSVEIESRVPVTGLCIDLSPDLLNDVMCSILYPNTTNPDLSKKSFFDSDEFFESKFKSNNTNLGSVLTKLDQLLSKNPYENHLFDNSFYFHIAEQLVKDYTPIVKQLRSINTIKTQTRKELFRKLRAGHDFLENNFTNEIHVSNVATNCGLSEYYFFRLFKTVYGLSPMQFVIQKRLDYSKTLLQKYRCSVSDAALLSGFSDIHAFSKAFKKEYFMAPSRIVK